MKGKCPGMYEGSDRIAEVSHGCAELNWDHGLFWNEGIEVSSCLFHDVRVWDRMREVHGYEADDDEYSEEGRGENIDINVADTGR